MDNRLNITVGFSRGFGWISKIICWITRSLVSHAWGAYDLFPLKLRQVMGAEDRGIIFRSWENFDAGNMIMAEFEPIGPPVEDSLRWFIKEHSGAPYDYGAAGVTAIRDRLALLWKKCGRWLRSKLSDPSKMMCSEVYVRLFQHAGYKATAGLDPETTDAQVLMDCFFAHPAEFKLIWADPRILTKYGVELKAVA